MYCRGSGKATPFVSTYVKVCVVDDGFGGATTAIDCEFTDGFVALPEEPERAGPPEPPAEEPPAELPPLELPLLPPRLDASELPVPEEALVPVPPEPAPANPAPVEVSPRHAPAVCVPAVWLPLPPLASVPALPVDTAAGVADAPAAAEVKTSAACVTTCAVAVPAVPPAVAAPASEFSLAGTLEMDVLVAAPDPPAPAPDAASFAAFKTITGALNMLAHVRTSTAPVASRLCWRWKLTTAPRVTGP